MNNLVLVSEKVKSSKHHKTIHEGNIAEKSYFEDKKIPALTLKSASTETKFSSLMDHFTKDEESGNFVCQYCCLSFPARRTHRRRDHLMYKHPDKVAEFGLLKFGFGRKHFTNDKETGSCICLYCSKVISGFDERHILTFHADKISEEDIAKPNFLLDHFSKDDTENYLCQHCGKCFEQLQSAKYHLISNHTDTIDESKVDKATLKRVDDRKNELNRIKMEMKNKKLMKETCPHCGKSYKGQTSKTCLKKHLKHFEANGECLRVTCNQCDKILKGKSLKSHIRACHEENAKEWEDCVECGKRLQRQSMKHHIFVHHSDAFVPFQCQHCEYSAPSKSELKRHTKIKHEEANPVHCPWCGIYVKCLDRHLKRNECNVPENERKKRKTISCDICLKKFTSYNSVNVLERHKKRVHEKIKDVHCERCDYKTYSKNNLYVHVKRMHEGRPYREQCPKCPKLVVNMEWHIKTYHPI